jgi:hypothetical protein
VPQWIDRRRAHELDALRTRFAQADGLPFADVLSGDRVDRALRAEQAQWRERVYTPLVTLWAFLSQALCPDGSCRSAVARVLAWLVARGGPACSPATGPYCKARRRLPEALLRRLACETGRALHAQARPGWRWKGRRVKVVDGTTVSMPDTPANRAAYPPPPAARPAGGFPLARLVVVFCLDCAAALEAALGRCQGKETGEAALLRALAGAFESGDVLLGDRCFGGWFDLALWRGLGVDAVVRQHQRRRSDFRRGRRLGAGDHVVTWPRPERPDWMSGETYPALPDHLEVREVRVRVGQTGFRTRQLVVVTTLLDAGRFAARDLAALYRLRWYAELDLRSLKVALGLDVLRCKTPGMVRKEVWARLLAYNLIRTVMAQAAEGSGCRPRELSFKGTLQALAAVAERLPEADAGIADELVTRLLAAVARYRVGDRPDRVEPRKRRRRPKYYPPLNQPRRQARNGTSGIR